ncbi:MAG: response regulator [Bacteroidota bacterium]
MNTGSASLQQRLSALRAAYLNALPERLGEIDMLWAAAQENPAHRPTLQQLHRALHNLAGSGLTYGVEAVSGAARAMLEALRPWTQHGQGLTAAMQAQAVQQLHALQGVPLHQPGSAMPAPSAAHSVPMRKLETAVIHGMTPQAVPPGAHRPERRVFVVEDDPMQAEFLNMMLNDHGYATRIITELSDLVEAIEEETPLAILTDMMFPEGESAGADTLSAIQAERAMPIPIIFMSARDDMDARLRAVRANGVHYFTKPLDVSRLISTLDNTTRPETAAAHRVLLIDDDAAATSFFGMVLGMAKMDVLTIDDPMQVMEALHRFRPDLVLVDLHLQGCTGAEVVAAIRQDFRYTTLPILFLSEEHDPEWQVRAMQAGGDAFIAKRARPEHLVKAIRSRVKRLRAAQPIGEAKIWSPTPTAS